ncbi:putative transposase [Ereboglobus sp. PH5-5]|uniref:transposase n=1 Tax=Ereboglobus sp. PH5-5 TaxID=2940529 RepID=UPI0024072D19|nr:transposase [Ereboglobus sp. PH5-5]MDF9833986.1 putative transposase [Ereboglobus sp. PH5-5]
MEELRFFSPYADTTMLRNRLPHWEQMGATYFVTFRLADSIPRELRERWIWDRDAWLKHNPPPHTSEQEAEYHQLFSNQMEAWLDTGMGGCVLRNSDAAALVARALQHFEGVRCHQLAFVIMPNHVHTVFATLNGEQAPDLVQSWKSFTSRKLREALAGKWPGWQKDYYDRMVRDEAHFGRCVRYIRKNPGKAKLPDGEFILFEGERARMC